MGNVAHSNAPRTGGIPPASWSPPGPRYLAKHHIRYLEERGVTLEAARAAGYWTARRPSEIPPAFSSYQRRRYPTLIAPHLSPDMETVSWQKHDDYPGKDRQGKPVKWASPPAERARTVLSVHPWTADEARRGTGPLWFCEGLTRGHALAGLGIPAVTYPGCYSWQKDGEPLECFEHLNLSGRLVFDVPDADYRTNEEVHKALAMRVRYLESRGARVLVVSVPEVNGDPHAGLDDYIAAGGDLEALIRDARPFVPVDVGRERLKRDERLRVFVAAKMREVEELPAPTQTACNGIKLARWMLENPAPAHGKLQERGLEIHASYPQMAEGVRLGSFQTVAKGLDWLKEAGVLEIERAPRGSRKASSYLLLYPSGGGRAKSVNMEAKGGGEEESQKNRTHEESEGDSPLQQQDSSLRLHSTRGVVKGATGREKVPALRNSKLVHTFGRREGRRVVVHSDYFKRYGSKREEILRRVIAAGRVDQ